MGVYFDLIYFTYSVVLITVFNVNIRHNLLLASAVIQSQQLRRQYYEQISKQVRKHSVRNIRKSSVDGTIVSETCELNTDTLVMVLAGRMPIQRLV
jgi:hypothetical protein